MPKQLKDILAGIKSSKIVPGSTGSDPGVDYAPKAPNEQEFVKKHSTEKHDDRVGNDDDVYQATNIKHSQVAEKKHGYKKPEDKAAYATEEAKCNMTEEGVACPVHEMADCSKSKKTLREIAKNPYAIGMAAAMKQTGDKPPLKKSTIVKGHEIAKAVKEEVEELDEASASVRSSNEYRGYHGQAYIKHQDKKDANELAHKDFAKAHAKVKKHAGEAGLLRDVKKPNVMIKHYLDSQSGRHLHGNEDNSSYVKRDFGKFKSKYDAEHFKEEVEQLDEVNHREYGAQGKMHPEMARGMKVGQHSDFFQHGTGDKAYGEVTKNDGKAVHLKVKNKTHKFTVTSRLSEETLEENHDDESAEMAKTQLRALANKALHLAMQLNDNQIVEPWVQAKIAVAKEQVTAVHDYMLYGEQKKETEKEQAAPYDGGIDMTGAPRNTLPSFSVDVNTGRNV